MENRTSQLIVDYHHCLSGRSERQILERMTIMKPYNSHEKKALFYTIQDTDGSPLDLMNIQTYKDGLLAAVTTFIGRHDRDEFGINAKSRGLGRKV